MDIRTGKPKILFKHDFFFFNDLQKSLCLNFIQTTSSGKKIIYFRRNRADNLDNSLKLHVFIY